MSSLIPRPPYSEAELRQLYPPNLVLEQVQLFIRHGERTPITNGLNHLLPSFWPLCEGAGKLSSTALMNSELSQWAALPWKRRVETIRNDGGPLHPVPWNGKHNSLCATGELTDTGRHSMVQLGQRLRHLYVDQLGFMPKVMSEQASPTLYLRASPYPRALESAHQSFLGFYPVHYRAATYMPEIVLRSWKDETLMPNEDFCFRFIQMMKAYSQRAADRWNTSEEMSHLNRLLQRYMPSQQRVAVDSTPRISGIYDAVNSTLAAPSPAIKLPAPFYDPTVRKILDTIAFEEEFTPFSENHEYRMLGIGALMGDMLERMVHVVDPNAPSAIKLGFSCGHDSTIMGILGSLGALKGKHETWPPYSSNIAVELFRSIDGAAVPPPSKGQVVSSTVLPIGRTRTEELSPAQKQAMAGWFVRVRYNDEQVVVEGCRAAGKHLDGEETFCTLAAFKEIVDKITPADWKKACVSNMDKPSIPKLIEPGGL